MYNPKSRKTKYILEPKPFNEGGQAELFLATHRQTQELVALKKLKDRDSESIARMRREIEVQTAITHRNVMPILDYSKSYLWYTMPVATRTLGQMKPPIDFDILKQIIQDCAKGLSEAHSKGFIHRDLSPNNILEINTNGMTRWVVADWGLVRTHGQTTIVRTLPGHPLGTLAFAAPEMWDDAHEVTAAADVYSLGCVIGWCVTGIWPRPNIPPSIDGVWSSLVSLMTYHPLNVRLSSMSRVLDHLEHSIITIPSQHSISYENIRPYYPEFLSYNDNNEQNQYKKQKYNPTAAKFIIKDISKQIINALAQKNINFLIEMIHPEKGVRFTPYTYVNHDDIVIYKNLIKEYFTSNKTLKWGYADGSGFPILLSLSGYFEFYIYDEDFASADQILYNEKTDRGGNINNSFDFYPESIIVEYHIIGSNPDYDGMDWKSLKLVFEEFENQWFLVGIIHDQGSV